MSCEVRITLHGNRGEYSVAPDMWGSEFAPHPSNLGGEAFHPSGDQLEPATDMNNKIEWKDAVFTKEGKYIPQNDTVKETEHV